MFFAWFGKISLEVRFVFLVAIFNLNYIFNLVFNLEHLTQTRLFLFSPIPLFLSNYSYLYSFSFKLILTFSCFILSFPQSLLIVTHNIKFHICSKTLSQSFRLFHFNLFTMQIHRMQGEMLVNFIQKPPVSVIWPRDGTTDNCPIYISGQYICWPWCQQHENPICSNHT